jgi:hypothetical protein
MKKMDVQKVISLGESTVVSIDPNLKTEISRRQIESVISDMKKHLSRNRRVHVVLVKE